MFRGLLAGKVEKSIKIPEQGPQRAGENLPNSEKARKFKQVVTSGGFLAGAAQKRLEARMYSAESASAAEKSVEMYGYMISAQSAQDGSGLWPFSEERALSFATGLREAGYAAGTVKTMVSHVRNTAVTKGKPTFAREYSAKLGRALMRNEGHKILRDEPIDLGMLKTAWENGPMSNYHKNVFRASSIMFLWLLRAREVCAPQLSDCVVNGTTSTACLSIRNHKSDSSGIPFKMKFKCICDRLPWGVWGQNGVSGQFKFCPFHILIEQLSYVYSIRRVVSGSTPLFVGPHGTEMKRGDLVKLIDEICKRNGFRAKTDNYRFCTHSYRAAGTQAYLMAEPKESRISDVKDAGRWSSRAIENYARNISVNPKGAPMRIPLLNKGDIEKLAFGTGHEDFDSEDDADFIDGLYQ
jgi:hypothetical protein